MIRFSFCLNLIPKFKKSKRDDMRVVVVYLPFLRITWLNKEYIAYELTTHRMIMHRDKWFAEFREEFDAEVNKQVEERILWTTRQTITQNKILKKELSESEAENQIYRSLKHFILKCNELLIESK